MTGNPFDDDAGAFKILVNDEGQHSLWPESLDVPEGWRVTGVQGDRATCAAWVDRNWTDMRPLSLVRRMDSGLGARPSKA
jgi:MbtH protein